MPNRNRLFTLLLLFSLIVMSAPANAAEEALFLNLIDGDSMWVEYQGRSREVRLIGIDAPEWGQEYGTKAKSHALNFCYGKQLTLEFDKGRKDKYGRLLAYVYCGKRMLNEELVRAGLALAVRYEPNVKYQKRLERAEKEARAKRNGFWLRGGLKQTPYEWRKSHRKK
ncbi:thermonuclease family protein [Pseudodesulfovibrio sp. zrk46]|uniref:thermonuclease family protein n=1 Tax=Pseudodesulfovibrio sp. zrk46 TaxID=2725288 RepID=UPI00144A2CEB|nr:thermonuclease family protein [Pseudodesulfovibrio sp. zrk46]QJB56205.1 thermonuclease family protein [Pseudodesulfovibrio sp. zrk46]